MMTFIGWMSAGLLAGIAYSSLFEWALHRYFMHRPTFNFRYPFERHALVHHRIFRADHTYHLVRDADKKTIPMAWWNAPVLICLGLIPFFLFARLTHYWGALAGGAVAMSAYYAAYEYIHWCMHLPRHRNVERSGLFFRLNGHHLLHHRYMNRNFNVVLPLADLFLGTLLTRSPVHFKQALGPAVPDVQPKIKPAATPAGP